jgi:hypothetical protein
MENLPMTLVLREWHPPALDQEKEKKRETAFFSFYAFECHRRRQAAE